MTKFIHLVILRCWTKVMMDKKERIIEAAISLFARYGIRKTTIDEIARNAQVGKGTIYLYFKNKEDIFASTLRQVTTEMIEALQEAVENGTSVTAQLKSLILTRFRTGEEKFKLFNIPEETRMEVVGYTKMHPNLFKEIKTYMVKERALIASILQAGVDRGELEIENIPLIAVAISNALQTVDHAWDFEGEDIAIEYKTELMVKLFIEGMKKR